MPGIQISINTKEAERAVVDLKKSLTVLGSSAATNEKEFKELETRLKRGMGADKAKDTINKLQHSLKLTRIETAKLKASTGDYTGALSTMVRGNANATKSFNTVALAASAMFGVFAAQQVARKALKVFSGIEAGLIAVKKTTNMTTAEIAVLNNEIVKMSKTLPLSTTELLEISAAAGQLGVKGTKNIMAFTETLAKMQLASDVVGEEGAKSLARLLNVTGETTDEVAVLGSVIVALGNNMAATEQEILTLATEVGQTTSVFAVSSKEAAGLAAAMKSIGVRAELGGSVVGRSMRAMEKSIQEGGASFTELMNLTQMTGDELKKTFKTDATKVFQSWIGGIGRATSAGRTASDVLEVFGLKGEEVLKVLPALAERSDILAKALSITATETANATALNNEALAASKGLGAQMDITKNYATHLGEILGEALAPEVLELSDKFRTWIDDNEELIQQEVPVYVDKIKTSISGLVDVVDNLGIENVTMGFIGYKLFGSATWMSAPAWAWLAVVAGYVTTIKQGIDESDGLSLLHAAGLTDDTGWMDTNTAKYKEFIQVRELSLQITQAEIVEILKEEQALREQWKVLGDMGAITDEVAESNEKLTRTFSDMGGIGDDIAESFDDAAKSVTSTKVAISKFQNQLDAARFEVGLVGLDQYAAAVKKIEQEYQKMIKGASDADVVVAQAWKEAKLRVVELTEKLDEKTEKEKEAKSAALGLASAEEKLDRAMVGVNDQLDDELFKQSIHGMSDYRQQVARIDYEMQKLIDKNPELQGLVEQLADVKKANLEAAETMGITWDNFGESLEGSLSGVFQGEFEDIGSFFDDILNTMYSAFVEWAAKIAAQQIIFNISQGSSGSNALISGIGSLFGGETSSSGASRYSGVGSSLSNISTANSLWGMVTNNTLLSSLATSAEAGSFSGALAAMGGAQVLATEGGALVLAESTTLTLGSGAPLVLDGGSTAIVGGSLGITSGASAGSAIGSAIGSLGPAAIVAIIAAAQMQATKFNQSEGYNEVWVDGEKIFLGDATTGTAFTDQIAAGLSGVAGLGTGGYQYADAFIQNDGWESLLNPFSRGQMGLIAGSMDAGFSGLTSKLFEAVFGWGEEPKDPSINTKVGVTRDTGGNLVGTGWGMDVGTDRDYTGKYVLAEGEHKDIVSPARSFDEYITKIMDGFTNELDESVPGILESINLYSDDLPDSLQSMFDGAVDTVFEEFDFSLAWKGDPDRLGRAMENTVSEMGDAFNEVMDPVVARFELLSTLEEAADPERSNLVQYSEALAALTKPYEDLYLAMELSGATAAELALITKYQSAAIVEFEESTQGVIDTILYGVPAVSEYTQALNVINAVYDANKLQIEALSETEEQAAAAELINHENRMAAEAEANRQNDARMDSMLASVSPMAAFNNQAQQMVGKYLSLDAALTQHNASTEQHLEMQGLSVEALAELIATSEDYEGAVVAVELAMTLAGLSAEQIADSMGLVTTAFALLGGAAEDVSARITDAAASLTSTDLLNSYNSMAGFGAKFDKAFADFLEVEQDILQQGDSSDAQMESFYSDVVRYFAELVAGSSDQIAALEMVEATFIKYGASDSQVDDGMAAIMASLDLGNSEVVSAVHEVATGIDKLVREQQGTLAFLPEIHGAICMSTASIEAITESIEQDWGTASRDLRDWMENGAVNTANGDSAVEAIAATVANFIEWEQAATTWRAPDTANDARGLREEWENFTLENINNAATNYGQEVINDPYAERINQAEYDFAVLAAQIEALLDPRIEAEEETLTNLLNQIGYSEMMMERYAEIPEYYAIHAEKLGETQTELAAAQAQLLILTIEEQNLLSELEQQLVAVVADIQGELSRDQRGDSVTIARSELVSALKEQVQSINDYIGEQEQVRDALADAAQNLRDAAGDIVSAANSILSPEAAVKSAGKIFDDLLADFWGNKDAETAVQLPAAANAYLTESLQTLGSSVEYRRRAGQIAAQLKEASAVADLGSVEADQQIIDLLSEQGEDSLAYYESALETFGVLNTSTMSVGEAIANYTDAILAQLDAGDKINPADLVEYGFLELLGRFPDMGGFTYYVEQLTLDQLTATEFIEGITNSDEYLARQNRTGVQEPIVAALEKLQGDVLSSSNDSFVILDSMLAQLNLLVTQVDTGFLTLGASGQEGGQYVTLTLAQMLSMELQNISAKISGQVLFSCSEVNSNIINSGEVLFQTAMMEMAGVYEQLTVLRSIQEIQQDMVSVVSSGFSTLRLQSDQNDLSSLTVQFKIWNELRTFRSSFIYYLDLIAVKMNAAAGLNAENTIHLGKVFGAALFTSQSNITAVMYDNQRSNFNIAMMEMAALYEQLHGVNRLAELQQETINAIKYTAEVIDSSFTEVAPITPDVVAYHQGSTFSGGSYSPDFKAVRVLLGDLRQVLREQTVSQKRVEKIMKKWDSEGTPEERAI